MKFLLIPMFGLTVVLMFLVNGYRPPGGYHALEYSAFSSSNVARPSLTPSELSSFTFGMELDYVFLLLYPTTLFLACRLLSRGFEESSRWRRIGHVLSLAMLTAIPSDLIDNISVLRFLYGGAERAWLIAGGICTTWNFTIGGLCLLYLIGGGLLLLRTRGRDAAPARPPRTGQTFSQVIAKEQSVISMGRQGAKVSGIAPDEFLGLALSGGGIRSATFNLGILQSLADLGLLRYVDYLSTVSGGGYIGSWLLARLKEDGNNIKHLQDKLSPKHSPDPDSKAWAPIRFLRDYSNYLTPEKGFLSADTWVTAGIWLRNTLLIQSVLVLALTALLIVPRWLFFIPSAVMAQSNWAAAIAAGLFVLLVLSAGMGLRGFQTTGTMTQYDVLVTVVGPLFLICWYSAIVISRASIEATNSTLWGLPVVVGLVVFVGLTIVETVGKLGGISRAPYAMFSGVLAGALTYVSMAILADNAPQGVSLWNVNTYGPFIAVAGISAVLTCHIGLLGRDLSDWHREWVSRAGAWLNIVALCWFALFFVAIYAPGIILWIGNSPSIQALLPTLSIGWVVSTIGGLISGWSAKSGSPGKPAAHNWVKLIATYAPYVFVAGLLCLLSFTTYVVIARVTEYDTWSQTLRRDASVNYWLVSTLTLPYHFGAFLLTSITLLAAAFLLSRRFDLNEFSMHHFYKNRLVRCYLGAARAARDPETARTPDEFTGFDPKDEIPLTEVSRRPYPIINTCLNLVHGKRLAWQERRAASFILSPEYCGFDHQPEPSTNKRSLLANIEKGRRLANQGYRPTSQYGGGIQLGTAMAISGAAVNPNMGSITSSATAFLMTTFNVRLGWWLANPRHKFRWRESSPRTGILYLLHELTGGTNEDGTFVNLSDGGHFENLGIYELVRRRCKYIIACDATGDGSYAFEDLGGAIRKCRADFGAIITLDFSQLVPDPQTHRSRTHCAVGTIEYPPIAGQRTPPGVLVYIKSSLTGDEPSDVLEHAGIHPQFPHDSTADQWFNESQFESYRQLGYHIGSKVFELSKRKLKNIGPPAARAGSNVSLGPLFEELRDRWHAPSAAVEKSFARHGEAFEQLLQELRTSSKLSGLTKEFYSKIPLGTVEEKFLYCNSIFQLMENVYIDLNLEDEFNHPDNEGWNEMFKSWWAAPEMKNTWAISKKTFGQRFQQWCEREL